MPNRIHVRLRLLVALGLAPVTAEAAPAGHPVKPPAPAATDDPFIVPADLGATPSRRPICRLTTLVAQGTCAQAAPAAETDPKAMNAAAQTAQAAQATMLKLVQQSQLAVSTTGESHGLTVDTANELVQILGQIVVDRASAEGFRLLQTRVVKLLGCDPTGAQPLFRATCDVIQSLRIQDIAMAPHTLALALLNDLGDQLFPKVEKNLGDPALAALVAFARRDLAPLIFRRGHGVDLRVSNLIVERLQSEGARILKAPPATAWPCRPDADQAKARAALAFAAAGLAACKTQNETDLGNCPIASTTGALFDAACSVEPFNTAVRDAAVKLGTGLLSTLTAETDQHKPDVKARLRSGNDVLFDYICMSVDFAGGCTAIGGGQQQQPGEQSTLTLEDALSDLRGIFAAAIDGDNLEVVVRSAGLLREVWPGADKAPIRSQRQRGLRLVAGLLDYTLTFDATKTVSAVNAKDGATAETSTHDQRTKILESLTADMTDRTGREGDSIFSLGGALRGVTGAWVGGGGKRAFYGPVSLTLGFSLDTYFQNHAYGLHLELNALDLGQYLSFDDKGTVRDVDAVAAFAPGAGVAFCWGMSLPFTVGVNASYAPRYQFSPDGSRGSMNVALTTGFYVPLLDFN